MRQRLKGCVGIVRHLERAYGISQYPRPSDSAQEGSWCQERRFLSSFYKIVAVYMGHVNRNARGICPARVSASP